MYIETKCPHCGTIIYIDVEIHNRVCIEKGQIKSTITDVRVTDTCSLEEIVEGILKDFKTFIYNGINKVDVIKILKYNYGIVEQYCEDILQYITTTFEMYCPDNEHLYFA